MNVRYDPFSVRAGAGFLILLFLVQGIFAETVHARSINDGIGRTSFSWLKSISDAGISAGGECFAARDDISAVLIHPAALGGITTPSVKMSYVSHYIDTQYGFIGYAGRFKERDLGIRLTYINYGEFNGRDINNESTGTFSAGDIGVSVNLAKKIRDDLKIGAAATYITSKLEDYTAQAALLDIGVLYYPPFEGLTVGAALMNMGKVLKSYSSGYEETLPVYLSIGARKKLTHSPVTVFTDVQFPNDNDIVYSYGLEVSVRDILFLYAGTKSRSTIDLERQKSDTDYSGFVTFGFGLELNRYRFNYAYCPDDYLDDIHKITMNFKVGPR